MTVPQLSPAPELTEAEKATVERFDAAEEPEEVVVERAARAMWATSHGLPWSHAEFRAEADDYRAMARAALTALRGDRAPLAGQHTTDEEGR